MSRKDIVRIGIDLGTTNSAIAINEEGKSIVIETNQGDLYMPSVFGFDKRKNKVVGTYAYDQLFKFSRGEDYKNYVAEIKRLMGTKDNVHFPIINQSYNPEEISAEILKELKSELHKKYPDISNLGAVITVPAFFDTVQSEATKRAGELAGFNHVVLVQEPIAAAMAYEFGKTVNENWLVYDLGGGTFDVALISSHNKTLRVIEHSGDNHLGGKDIDELIVNNVLVPEITKNFNLIDFNSNNPKYGSHFLRLKRIAESGKIKLSNDDKVYLDSDEVNFNLHDEDGREVFFSIPLNVNEFNKLITPLIDKTLEKMNEVITNSKINKKEITKVIFVGATTKIPYIKERVETTMKIPVDVSINPFTIVSKGAAIFALSQKIPQDLLVENEELSEDVVRLNINYNSMTNEKDELITGTLKGLKDGQYHLQVSSKSGFYNSDRIEIDNGTFHFFVSLEENKENEFWIYLIDNLGNSLPIYPSNFSIVQGVYVSGIPIPHTIGVIYNQKDKNGNWEEIGEAYFEKNSVLPLSKTMTFKTINKVNKGSNEILPIVVYEGDYSQVSLNQEITRIGIDGNKIPMSLAEGEEIDITININESRELEVEAYIPVLDVALNARVDIHSDNIENKFLLTEIDNTNTKLKNLNDLISSEEKQEVKAKLDDLKTQLDVNQSSDNKNKIDREIKLIKDKLNTINENSSFDRLKSTYINKEKVVEDLIYKIKEERIKNSLLKELNLLKDKFKSIEESENINEINLLIKEIEYLEANARREDPMFWIGLYHYIENNISSFTNNNEASRIKREIMRNASDGNLELLKNNIMKLMDLIPREETHKVSAAISGITK